MKYGEYKPKSSFLKLADGENKVRFVSEAEEFMSEYQGKFASRFIAYVIDRTDGQIKPFTFGSSIMGYLAGLAASQEYGFDNLPPYDIIIIRKGAGIDTEYTVNAARKDSALTDEEKAAIEQLKPITELAKKLDKGPQQGPGEPIIEPEDGETISTKDIPF